MARTYGPAYARIWESALELPSHGGLLASLAWELASFTGTSVEDALREMRATWERRAEVLADKFPGQGNGVEVGNYYRDSDHAVASSAYWHSLEPDNYALHSVAGLHIVQEFCGGTRILDFGCGIGSTGILFCQAGFDVTLADVSKRCLAFARHRFALRGLAGRFVDLSISEPDPNSFDAVVSFDVLEHLVDPLQAIRRMHRWLVPGGVLVMNVAFGLDPMNPEHLLARRRGVLDRIRGLGFEHIANPMLLVYWKRSLRPWERLLFRVQDWNGAIRQDVAARWPRLRLSRLLTATRNPPIGRDSQWYASSVGRRDDELPPRARLR